MILFPVTGFISSGEKISIGIISPYNAQIAAIK